MELMKYHIINIESGTPFFSLSKPTKENLQKEQKVKLSKYVFL